jgi:hypothetical protein
MSVAKEFASSDAEAVHASRSSCSRYSPPVVAGLGLLNSAGKGRGDGGRSLVSESGLVFKEYLSRDTSGDKRDACDRNQTLYAMEPNYVAHNLKKKTRKQHIASYARAPNITVIVPAEVSTGTVVRVCCHGS